MSRNEIILTTAGLMLILFLTGCATNLTEAGRRIKVIDDPGSESVGGCIRLGSVTGEARSILTGGNYGAIYATNDARNRAAQIPAVDTVVITERQNLRFGGRVTGIAYDCGRPAQKATSTTAPADGTPDKAGKCQAKGGIWRNNQCIIPIE